jgi:hypothetical protein
MPAFLHATICINDNNARGKAWAGGRTSLQGSFPGVGVLFLGLGLAEGASHGPELGSSTPPAHLDFRPRAPPASLVAGLSQLVAETLVAGLAPFVAEA